MGDHNKSTFVPEWQHNTSNSNSNNSNSRKDTYSNRGDSSALKRKTSFAATPTFINNKEQQQQQKDNNTNSNGSADTSTLPKLNRSKSSPQIDIVPGADASSHIKERSFSPSPILPTTFDNNKTFVIPRYNINTNNTSIPNINIYNNNNNNNNSLNHNIINNQQQQQQQQHSNYNTYHHNNKFKVKPQLVSFKSHPNLNSLDKTNNSCNNSNQQQQSNVNNNYYSNNNNQQRYNIIQQQNEFNIMDPLSSSTMSLTSSTSSLSSSSSSTFSITSSSHNFVNNQDFFVCDSIIEEDHHRHNNNNNNHQIDETNEFPPLSSSLQINKPKGRSSTPTLQSVSPMSNNLTNNNNNNNNNSNGNSLNTFTTFTISSNLPNTPITTTSQQTLSSSTALNIPITTEKSTPITLASMISSPPIVSSSPTSLFEKEDPNTILELEKVKVLVPVKSTGTQISGSINKTNRIPITPSSNNGSGSIGVGGSTNQIGGNSGGSGNGVVVNNININHNHPHNNISQSALISTINSLKKNQQHSTISQQKGTMKAPAISNLPKDPKSAFRKTFSEPNLAGVPLPKDQNGGSGGPDMNYTPSRKGLTDPNRKTKVPKPDKLLGKEKNKNSFFEVIIKREETVKKLQNDGYSQDQIDEFLDNNSEYNISDQKPSSSSTTITATTATTSTIKPISILKSKNIASTTTTTTVKPITTTVPLSPILKNPIIKTTALNNTNTHNNNNSNTKNISINKIDIITSPQLSPITSPSLINNNNIKQQQSNITKQVDIIELEINNSNNQDSSEGTEEDEEHEERFLRGLGWVPSAEEDPSLDEINEILNISKSKKTITTTSK